MRIVTDLAEARRLLTRRPGMELITGLAGHAAPQAAETVERIVADVLDYSRQILNGGTVQEREFALAELQRQLAQGPELLVARASVEALA